MSYSKLLQFIIAALQSTVLEFPSGLKHRVWLYDANVQYFTPSRTPHFLASVVIIIAGGLFTLQLFLAQWLPHCSKWKLMRWTRNVKYNGFMDVYHAPFTRKHRYWVGLLLFTLIIHNVVTALATDNFLTIMLAGSIAYGLTFLKLIIKSVYKNRVNDLLENIFLLNLVFLTFGIQYLQNAGISYSVAILANVSMSISALLFLVILSYHSYNHVYLQSRFYRRNKTQIKKAFATVWDKFYQGSKRREIKELVTNQGGTLKTPYTAMRSCHPREPDLDLLSPITADDYRSASPPCKTNSKVTYTVVERKTPALALAMDSNNSEGQWV